MEQSHAAFLPRHRSRSFVVPEGRRLPLDIFLTEERATKSRGRNWHGGAIAMVLKTAEQQALL